mmetsp:Transcript_1746/g.3415  ORF Transcript_1746/g.3415 Transcript_1746/m.3415 type:complete len:287 (+) Transcript_1746:406-1266(+)
MHQELLETHLFQPPALQMYDRWRGTVCEGLSNLLKGQEQCHPVCKNGLELCVIKVRHKEHKVGVALHLFVGNALTDSVPQLTQDTDRRWAVLEALGQVLRDLGREERRQQVHGDTPALRGEVDEGLLPSGEVQLRLQRVKDEVHLVDHANTLIQQLHTASHLQSLGAHGRCIPAVVRVTTDAEVLNEPQHQRLHILWLHNDDVALRFSHLQLVSHVQLKLRGPVTVQGDTLLLNDGGEHHGQNGPCKGVERTRDNETHEARGICQKEGQQGGHNCGLACPHDHLLH